jgi:hypothetical protein
MRVKTNIYGQTAVEAARARVLVELDLMATDEHGIFSVSDEGKAFYRLVRKEYAKIHNDLAKEWGMYENVIGMGDIK